MKTILIFNVDDYTYGLPIENIKEIIRIVAFNPMPKQPPFVEGIFNLRGEVVPLIDFRRRFLMGVTEKDISKRIIVSRFEKYVVGFLVDHVEAVKSFNESELKDISNEKLGLDFNYIENIVLQDEQIVAMLNLKSLFSKSEIDELDNFISQKTEKTETKKKSTPKTGKK